MSNYNDGIDQSEIEGLEKENSEYYNRCEDLLVEKESLEKQLSDANATINQMLYDKFIKAIGTEVEVRMKGGTWHKKVLADYQQEYNCPFITKAANDLPLSYADGGDYWDECRLPENNIAELEAVKAERDELRAYNAELQSTESIRQMAVDTLQRKLASANALIEEMRRPEKAPILFNNWMSVRDALDTAYKELGLEKIHEPKGSRFPSDHWNIAGLIYKAAQKEYLENRGSCWKCGTPLTFESAIRCLDCKTLFCEWCAKKHFGDGHANRAKAAHLAPVLPAGWKAVPVESTDEMGDAMNDAWLDITRKPIPLDTPSLHDIYEAAIAAAPELPK